jgi:cytochrome c oxidase subunit I+III
LFVANVLWSLKRGAPAGDDPWRGDTLEWAEGSLPPHGQFASLPVVSSRHPLWEQASLSPEDRRLAASLRGLDHGPLGWRGALVVSTLDARPLAVVHLPGPTIAPFALSVGFVLLFAGALVDGPWLAGLGALVSGAATVGWFWPQ